MPLGASFFEDEPLVDFIYLVFARTPGGVTVGDSGLCCCVPCLSSAIISLCLVIQKGLSPFRIMLKKQKQLSSLAVANIYLLM